MNRLIPLLLVVLLSVFMPEEGRAYTLLPDSGDAMHMEFTEQGVKMEISRRVAHELQDSLLRDLGFSSVESLDSFWQAGQRSLEGSEGWELVRVTNKLFEFQKTMEKFSEGMSKIHSKIFMMDEGWLGVQGGLDYTFFPQADYGVNRFKRPTIRTLSNGQTQFFLPDYERARQVLLSGNFNSWNTSGQVLTKTDSGWVGSVNLSPGKHLYKFIVDGYWINDENNELKEPDGHSGFNSVYFRSNVRFYLPEHKDAKKVFVTGSFNGWDEKELAMQRWLGGWVLEMYVREGQHSYKFKADKQWLLDPNNAYTRADGNGNTNNVLALGTPVKLFLKGFEYAQSVFLAGTFNDWNERELLMERSEGGWTTSYVIPAGIYQYKLIVDGAWTVDPANPHRDGSGEFINNVLVVEPNQRFRLNGNLDARQVLVSGTFNNWSETGFTMARDETGWYMDVALKPGKHRYKFVVDGKWILDPDNSLWEENELGSGNSVLWVEVDIAGR
ncbi:MAG: hypothetical protein GC205_12005 [Bacteroidetes bacterium]|nr:hypothetical protein [Bacteroidota bacterium]